MTLKITQADWDRVWLELAELRQSLNARQIAPTPDYRSDLPAEEPCSCEESERLKAELGEAHVEIAALESHLEDTQVLRENFEKSEAQLAAANALLRRCTPWTDELRAAIQAHLSSQSAAPAPGSVLRDGSWIRTPEEERGNWDQHDFLPDFSRKPHG